MGRKFRTLAVLVTSGLLVSSAGGPLTAARAERPTGATSQAADTQNLEFVAINVGNFVAASPLVNLTCNQVQGRGKFGLASGSPPQTRTLTLTSLDMRHNMWPTGECRGPNNMKVKVTPRIPMQINLATLIPQAAQIINGTLTAQNGLSVAAKGSDGCDIVISGSSGPGAVGIKYTYSTDRVTFTTPSNLHIASADAECDPTLIKAGDKINITGTLQIRLARIRTVP